MRDFTVGNLIKSYRTRLGLQQNEVADPDDPERLPFTLRTYQGWENGERIPSNERLHRIASFFHLTDAEADELYRAAAQVAPEIHNLPFQRNPFFTGRETYLKLLDRDFKKSSAVAITQPISISGLGGIGKTQLALEYAHICHPKVYRTVLWVNASNQAMLEASFLSLAHILKLPERDEHEAGRIVQAVKTWLEGHTSWLLVFDNADDLQLARTFLPTKPRGHILLTTRLQIVGNIAIPMPLEAMKPEEGQRFLLLRSGDLKPGTEIEALAPMLHEATAQLVKLLGGHPLALDQAGAYIEDKGVSFHTYIQLYHEQRRILLNKRGPLGNEHPETVVVTFEVSFQRACEVCPSAADVLALCAFLHPDAIPEEVFSHDEHLKLSPLEFEDAIGALRRYSLINRNVQDKLISVHRLVQAVLRDGMEQETVREWEERVILSVNKAFPHAEHSTWAQCERLLPQALLAAQYMETEQITGEEAVRLLNETASYLQDHARYFEAEPLVQFALHICEQTRNAEHPDIASALNYLAALYRAQGRYEEAEPLLQRALAIREKILGPEDLDTVQCVNNLGGLYNTQGRYEEAEPLLQRALAIREKILGPEHINTARSLTNLAMLYHNQENYQQEEPLLQRVLAIREKALEPMNPDIAQTLNSLAMLYMNQGRYEEAEPLYQRALKIREYAFGVKHTYTAQTLNNLGRLYRLMRMYERAESFIQRGLVIWLEVLGTDHSYIASSLNNLAMLYHDQRRYEEAEPLYQRALTIRERGLGPKHPYTADVLENYARLLHEIQRPEQAKLFEERAQSIRANASFP